MGQYYDRYVENGLVKKNSFIGKKYVESELPKFGDIKGQLPKPFWDGHDDVIRCYWDSWRMAFEHLKKPTADNGFVADYIGTCFNDCLFMWDSVIALMYGKYGIRAFDFQHTLDNLYAKQHPDGFICREIAEDDGSDRFHRFDPSSTGPNILPWSEWEYFSITKDKNRLRQVFPVLLAYHQWLKAYRTWPDGTYWSSGWGAGLDNQPRLKGNESHEFYHGHMTWVDTCLQAVFSAKILIEMAKVLDEEHETKTLKDEIYSLSSIINEGLWDHEANYYFDRYANGSLSGVMTISAYWALLADIVPEDRLMPFASHLENSDEYNRAHRVPSMPANQPGFCPDGSYWKGGVWVFTNYMLLRGLTKMRQDTLAYHIALNHVKNVVDIYKSTGTIWENYAPDTISPGTPALRDFVGAGGVTPIAILFEYIFGLRIDNEASKFIWDVRRLEAHGVADYPLGPDSAISLKCESRHSYEEEPAIEISSNVPLKLEVRWNHEDGVKTKIYQF